MFELAWQTKKISTHCSGRLSCLHTATTACDQNLIRTREVGITDVEFLYALMYGGGEAILVFAGS